MGFRPKSLNATKKSFEARVTLLSRYSFPQKDGLPRIPGYPLIHTLLDAKLRCSSVTTVEKAQKRWSADAIAPICCDLPTAFQLYMV